MTQYPSPYSQPPYSTPPAGYPSPYGYNGPDDLLAPARRSGILMIVLGALCVVIGLCMGLCAAIVPQMKDQLQGQEAQAMEQLQQQTHLSLQVIFLAMCIAMLVVGLLYIVFGVLTRAGGLGMVVTSIVITSLTVLYLILNTLALLAGGGAPGACISGLAMGGFIWLLVWLVQAARMATRIPHMQAQYQTQYQHYAQMQQMYGQQGYGYGAPQAQQQPPPTSSSEQPPPPQYPSPPSNGG